MPAQTLPPAVRRYATERREDVAAALSSVAAAWRSMDPADVDGSWSRVEPRILAVVMAAQVQAVALAQEYVPEALAATGQTEAVRPRAVARTTPLVAVAGDGRDLASLLDGALVGVHEALAAGATGVQALKAQSSWLTMTAGTVLADSFRQSTSLAMGVRQVTGYVRMLQPPSCSRCAILAGRYYYKNTGFQRHPRCDCIHIPASESVAEDLCVNQVEYFDSLSQAEQDRIFTKAGAEAVRSGADMNQVVNARRGMKTAQIGGRKVLITTEGTTRRGFAHHRLSPSGSTDVKPLGVRYASARRPRLMPETISQVATDQADYLRLLRANGYIL